MNVIISGYHHRGKQRTQMSSEDQEKSDRCNKITKYVNNDGKIENEYEKNLPEGIQTR